MGFRVLWTIVAAALVWVPLLTWAKDPIKPSLAYARPSADLHGTMDLSLHDALTLGLENNLNIAILRHQPLISHEDYRTAWGRYDPEWFSEFGYSDEQQPTSNQIEGSQPGFGGDTVTRNSKVIDGFGGFRGLIPGWGASYEMSLSGESLSTDAGIFSLDPQISSGVEFRFVFPMLRGLIWNEPWTLVKTSQAQEQADWEQFRTDVMDTVLTIEVSYWQLIADDELVRVAEKSVETARALLDQVQTQYEVGVVSKVEIAEAEAGLAQRDFDLIVAENNYGDQMDALINETLGPNLTAATTVIINPTDRPDEFIAYDIDNVESTKIAFANRPELAILRQQIEQLEIRLKFAKNQRLPQFDAVLGYGNRGLGGFDRETGEDRGDYGDSLDGFLSSNAPMQFNARALVSIPLPNTAGRAGVSRAKLELRRAEISRRRQEQDIIVGVRKAARRLEAAQGGIRAAERAEAAASEQLRAEKIRLEYGESTPFDVLLREQDLVTAQQRFIGAFNEYRQSITGLDRQQGTILRNRNIQIEEAARLR